MKFFGRLVDGLWVLALSFAVVAAIVLAGALLIGMAR